jgi:hypothetical protein
MLSTLTLVTKDAELDDLAAEATTVEDTAAALADKVAQAIGVKVFPPQCMARYLPLEDVPEAVSPDLCPKLHLQAHPKDADRNPFVHSGCPGH